LGISQAEIAVISILAESRQGIKRTLLGSLMTPDEFFPFLSKPSFLPVKTFHFLALATEKGGIEARIEIVFLNTNG
jgi:hypothetical protein